MCRYTDRASPPRCTRRAQRGAYQVHGRHRCGVPVRYRTVRRRRRRRIAHPRRHGSPQIGDGRQRGDVRRQREEQREAHEAVRPPQDGPAAQETTRRVATQFDAWQRGMATVQQEHQPSCDIDGCILLQPSSSQRVCRTKIIISCNSENPAAMYVYRTPRAATSLHNHCNVFCCLALQRSTPCCDVTVTITWSHLELGATCCNVLHRSHEVRDGQPICGSCDALADRHCCSGGSRAHRVAKEPKRSCPTCHRNLMLCASFGVCTTVRTQTRYSEYSHGVLGLKPMRTLHSGALTPVGPILSTHMGQSQYSHEVLGVLWVLTLGRFECSHGVIRVLTPEYSECSQWGTVSTHRGPLLTQVRFAEYSNGVLSSYLTTAWYPMRRRCSRK
jgi:hypothetical protein